MTLRSRSICSLKQKLADNVIYLGALRSFQTGSEQKYFLKTFSLFQMTTPTQFVGDERKGVSQLGL